MLNRSRNKRATIDLVDESQDRKIFASKRTIGKKVVKKFHFVLKHEPLFYLENSHKDKFQFIRHRESNRLVGLIKDGELEDAEDVDKLFFLSKLDLKPSHASSDQGSPAPSPEDESGPDVDSASCISPDSPCPTSPGSTNGIKYRSLC